MYLEFMWIAACAAVGMAIMAGILGCFVVWRRMAYFGDALSHASVLGVAVSLGFGFSVYLGVAGIACLVAILLWGFVGSKHSADSLLGVISHGALAIGLIAAALWGNGMSLEAVLFGDILVLGWRDALYIWGGVGVAGCWRDFDHGIFNHSCGRCANCDTHTRGYGHGCGVDWGHGGIGGAGWVVLLGHARGGG